jgi:hypothetical protein
MPACLTVLAMRECPEFFENCDVLVLTNVNFGEKQQFYKTTGHIRFLHKAVFGKSEGCSEYW